MSVSALSWDIWPTGATAMTPANDRAWTALLGPSKTYIMGISPWFYTSLPQYGKNWLARGAGLWHARWQAAVALRPPMVEVVTWNDFGESSYVGPANDTETWPKGSEGYVKGMDHGGWRATLPAYIAAYKAAAGGYAGTGAVPAAPTPTAAAAGCSAGGTTALYASAMAPQVAQDAIDVYAVVKAPAEVQVQIGGVNATFAATTPGVNHFSVPLQRQTGAVEYALVRGGKRVAGGVEKGVSADCSRYGGKINFNAVTGVFYA